ncbi:MAG: photosynthetic complex assembly protein PuhC [Deltaproteobacteria bacterium]|jgi:putative photosynthetic complex assembly protein
MAHHHEQRVPRPALLGALVLMIFTILIAGAGRRMAVTDRASREPPRRAADLRFEDRDDGSVAALDPEDGREIAIIEPGSNGFIRGVLRGMFRTRRLESVPPQEPFRLSEEADGRLVLTDPRSGRHVELRSFGGTNYDAFAALLNAAIRSEERR